MRDTGGGLPENRNFMRWASINGGGEEKEFSTTPPRFQASAAGYVGLAFPNLENSWRTGRS